MIASNAARRQAMGLVEIALQGKLDQHTRGLIEQARQNPVRTAEVVAVLVELLAGPQLGRPEIVEEDPSVPPIVRHLRKAHAAYSGGDRSLWVVEGERLYQRQKKREQRMRDRAKAQVA